MAMNPHTRRSLSYHSLLLILLLPLVGILSGCGASSTAGPSHPSGATPTSTPAQELKGTISEFPLPPSLLLPTDITKGSDGNLWFIAATTQTYVIGRSTPTGVISVFPIPTKQLGAFGIIDGPDGNLWFSEGSVPWAHSEKGKIGRITPSGTIREFSLSSNRYPGNVTTGRDGALWFIEFDTNNKHYKIGRITPAGTISEFPLSFPPQTTLGGITTGSDGNFWGIDSGFYTSKGMIWRITPRGTISAFPLPNAHSPTTITAGPDGNLWFGENDSHGINGKIGRITPAGKMSEFPLPTPDGSSPAGITAGPDSTIWFTEIASGKIGRLA